MRSFHVVGKKIVGVSLNYACRAAELGVPLPATPAFFLKPPSSYVLEPKPLWLPAGLETRASVSLGVIVRAPGANIAPEHAHHHIGGLAFLLDLWAVDPSAPPGSDVLRAFDTFTALGTYVSAGDMDADPAHTALALRLNGKAVQRASAGAMRFGYRELLAAASRIMRLERGDLVLTGTPAGAPVLSVGDTVEASLNGTFRTLRFKCVPRPLARHGRP